MSVTIRGGLLFDYSLKLNKMELKGKIVRIFPIESGESKSGKAWQKQNFVIEYQDGNYTRKALITGKSEPILFTIGQLKPGDTVNCNVTVEAREWNDRFFTDVTAWKISKADVETPF